MRPGLLVDATLLDGTIADRATIGPLADLGALASLVLAAVFLVAAVTKAIDSGRTTDEFRAIGLPAPAWLARIVPAAELLVAVALLARPTLGSALAAGALIAFTAVLGSALRAGRTVTCGCFGSLGRRPVTRATITRNLVLLALTPLAAATAAPAGAMPTLPALDVVLAVGPAVLLVVLGHQLVALRGRIGRIWSVELAGEPSSRRGLRANVTLNGANS